MTTSEKLKLLRAAAEQKSKFIDGQLEKLEKLMDKLGYLLNQQIVDDFLKELDVKDGIIVSDAQNQRKTALIDKANQTFKEKHGYRVVTTMIEDMYSLSGLNNDYFNQLQGMKVNGSDIESIVKARLGLTEDGKLKREGFMKGLLDNNTVRDEIKNYAISKTVGGTGYEDLRNGLKDLIVGNDEKMGKFKQFYRNTAYDTYAKIDRLNGKLYGDKLNMNFFIYAGTRRTTSRHFCIHKKGKVFSREEADEWHKLIGTTTTDPQTGKRIPAGPIVTGEDVPTYNPLVDLGGYGCVDDVMWISDEIAFRMRPELKKEHNLPGEESDAETIQKPPTEK